MKQPLSPEFEGDKGIPFYTQTKEKRNAMKRIRVRPGKASSTVGFIMGLIFVGIGICFAIPFAGLFGVFWTAIAVAITVLNGVNAFGKRGVATHEIVIDGENITDSIDFSQNQEIKTRLANLQDLYESRLITAEEYEQKRKEILDEV